MSTTTPNLSLTLYDSSGDQSVTFATFRAVWGGTATTSNFYRIDTWAGTINSSITTLTNQRGAIPVSAAYVSANYYEATVASITSYVTGMTILLKLDTTSNGTVTLNISSLGTKSVTKVNSSGSIVNIGGGELSAGRYYMFTYDGTQWVWVNAQSSDQVIVVGGTSGNVLTVSSSGAIDGTTTQSLLLSQTIHAATSKTTPADSDEIGIADSAASYVLKKLTWSNLKTGIITALGALINGITAKTTPVGADKIAIGDSESSFASKSVLLSDLYKGLGTGTASSSNMLLGDGSWGRIFVDWKEVSDTWTYASANTVTVPSGADSIYKKGMGVRWKQGGGYKYGYISVVADTLLTITAGTDYTIANSAITNIAYTYTPRTALEFPVYFTCAAPTWDTSYIDNGTGGQQPTSGSQYFSIDGIYVELKIQLGTSGVIKNTTGSRLTISALPSTLPSMADGIVTAVGTAFIATVNNFGVAISDSSTAISIYTPSSIVDNASLAYTSFLFKYRY